jgi:DNA polymerase-3 subunit gamma/tau
LLQAVPDLQLDEAEDIETYKRLASALSPEDAQLFYQIAIVGRRDLELAPDVRGGFEMVLLRMLAFGMAEGAPAQVSNTPTPVRAVAAALPSASTTVAEARRRRTREREGLVGDGRADESARHGERACRAHLVHRKQGNKVQLVLDADGEHFRRPQLEEKLAQALSAYFGEPVRLELTVADRALDTLARQQKAAADDRVQQARAAIEGDPNVRAMRDMFGATVQPDSIRPTE